MCMCKLQCSLLSLQSLTNLSSIDLFIRVISFLLEHIDIHPLVWNIGLCCHSLIQRFLDQLGWNCVLSSCGTDFWIALPLRLSVTSSEDRWHLIGRVSFRQYCLLRTYSIITITFLGGSDTIKPKIECWKLSTLQNSCSKFDTIPNVKSSVFLKHNILSILCQLTHCPVVTPNMQCMGIQLNIAYHLFKFICNPIGWKYTVYNKELMFMMCYNTGSTGSSLLSWYQLIHSAFTSVKLIRLNFHSRLLTHMVTVMTMTDITNSTTPMMPGSIVYSNKGNPLSSSAER